MKKLTLLFAAVLLVAVPLAVHAGDDHGDHGKTTEAKTAEAKTADAKTTAKKAADMKTVMGEVVDTGCYLSHAAVGEKHASCATKCIANGMPMGLLTADGTLYLLTMNHDNPDSYNALKGMAAKHVSITGKMIERSGMKGIDVSSYAAAEMKEVKKETKEKATK